MIVVSGIEKSFGETRALAGVDLRVDEGTILGLLGPNGAGKTTLVRILATLSLPDTGSATIGGFDVVHNAHDVRLLIGLAGQYAAVDDALTGRENLELVGRLYRLSRAEARRRAADTLERLSLTDAADRPVRTYSGGMRRRLDLGASLVGRPRVLILDEPTSGLDPRTRIEMWDFIKTLVAEGATVLLTTQYLDEADHLADRLVVIDRGGVVAAGTPADLKHRLGGDVIEVQVAAGDTLKHAAEVLAPLGVERPQLDPATRRLSLPVSGGAGLVVTALRQLDEEHIEITDIALRRPSLDDVFLALTGHRAVEEDDAATPAPTGRGRSRR